MIRPYNLGQLSWRVNVLRTVGDELGEQLYSYARLELLMVNETTLYFLVEALFMGHNELLGEMVTYIT